MKIILPCDPWMYALFAFIAAALAGNAWHSEAWIRLRTNGKRIVDLDGRAGQLLEFYRKHVRRAEFIGARGVRIRYDHFPVTDARGALAIAHGTGEASVRYAELVHDLLTNDLGYELYLINFRGQGCSQRLVGSMREWQPEWDPFAAGGDDLQEYRKTHIDDFTHYVDDLHHLVTEIIQPAGHRNLYALGNSMGGGILARHMELHPGIFNATALFAPMLRVRWPLRPDGLMAPLLKLMAALNGKGYAWRERPFRFLTQPFEGNLYTGSRSRFIWRKFIVQENPETVLGGKTWGWACQIHTALQRIRRDAARIQTPVLLLTAEEDRRVDPSGHKILERHSTSGRLCRRLELPGARHDILQERDEIRNRALDEMIGFFREHQI